MRGPTRIYPSSGAVNRSENAGRPRKREAGPNAKGTKPIRILLADDHPVVRKGICACLARHANIHIVGEAADGQEATVKAKELLPDLVLMDIDMPLVNGLAATEQLCRELPQIKVIILSMHSHPEYVVRILQSGARGYVLKDSPPEQLLAAIETVQNGETFFSPGVARVALDQFIRGVGQSPDVQLSRREREVLVQIAEGFSNKEIASLLGVGVRTVETHRERIMRKLDIHTVAGLTRFAIAKGLVVIQEEFKS